MLEDFLDVIGFRDDDSQDNIERDISGQWVDTDGDGIYESFLTDMDRDGINESLLTDLDGDGIFDALAMDMDRDGIFDDFKDISSESEDTLTDIDMETYAVDIDEDGIADTLITEIKADSDSNSHPDYYSLINEADMDGDGVTDFITFSEDTNGDLFFNAVTQWEDQEGEGNLNLFYSESADAEAYNIYDHFNPEESDGTGIIGNPGAAIESWHLQSGNTCAVVSQEFVLESIFDREFDEFELREIAEDNGWYNNGTSMEDVGKILEYYGANVEQSTGNSLDDLKSSLADGNQIIAGVDADELWSGQNEEMFGPGMDANHAIQVIGFDESDPANPMIIINDSGVANGQGVMIPAEEFMDAWEDSGCFMVESY